MKKISQIQWNNYKKSKNGKKTIALFERICRSKCTMEELYAIAKRFDPEYLKNINEFEKYSMVFALSFLNNLIFEILDKIDYPKIGDEFADVYVQITHTLSSDKEEISLAEIPQRKYEELLNDNIFLSLILFAYMPEFYIPNFFVMQFIYLKKFAEKYDIDLPEVPDRDNYMRRWLYYIEMCDMINQFALYNEIFSRSELCAFLYDYEFQLIKEEISNDCAKDMPEFPAQAWIIAGNHNDGDETIENELFEANELTKKGDIFLYYEKNPVKALNTVWIAQTDAVADPFCQYYSYAYIGNKITIPAAQAIKLEVFKKNKYFRSIDKKRNYVSKNFHYVNGWEVTYDDYEEIKRLLESKGFVTTTLPRLQEPK